jgi:hypothetical protein
VLNFGNSRLIRRLRASAGCLTAEDPTGTLLHSPVHHYYVYLKH